MCNTWTLGVCQSAHDASLCVYNRVVAVSLQQLSSVCSAGSTPPGVHSMCALTYTCQRSV
jgi:hypothetical protein